jgi:cytochrome c oxidase assembly factor CtaG
MGCMKLNYRKWKPRTRVIIVLITIVIFFVLGIAKGHAEETVSDHVKEAVYETLVGSVAAYGAVESAVMGNLGMGLAL